MRNVYTLRRPLCESLNKGCQRADRAFCFIGSHKAYLRRRRHRNEIKCVFFFYCFIRTDSLWFCDTVSLYRTKVNRIWSRFLRGPLGFSINSDRSKKQKLFKEWKITYEPTNELPTSNLLEPLGYGSGEIKGAQRKFFFVFISVIVLNKRSHLSKDNLKESPRRYNFILYYALWCRWLDRCCRQFIWMQWNNNESD